MYAYILTISHSYSLNPDGRARVRLVRATRSDLTSTSTSAPRLPDHASAARNRAAAEFARCVAISRRARASRMARAHDAESDIGRCANDAAIARRPRVRRAFATPSEAVMSRRGAEAPSQ